MVKKKMARVAVLLFNLDRDTVAELVTTGLRVIRGERSWTVRSVCNVSVYNTSVD